MFKTVPTALWLASSSLCVLWACSQKDENGGFGGGGSSFDPVTDTGPWYAKEDTASPDTGTSDTDSDTGKASDTGSTDTADTGEAPIIEGTGYAEATPRTPSSSRIKTKTTGACMPSTENRCPCLWRGLGHALVPSRLPDLPEETYDIVAAPVLSPTCPRPQPTRRMLKNGPHSTHSTPCFGIPQAREVQTAWAPLVRPRLFLIDDE